MSAPLLHAFPLQTFTKQLSFGGCWLNFFRCYARHNWNKRRPLRVMVGEESVEFRNLRQAPTSEDPQQSKVVKQTLPDKQSLVFGKKVKFKLPEDIEYERLQEADKRFGPMVLKTKSKKSRAKDGLILLEGKRLILEAIECGLSIKNLYFDNVEILEDFPFKRFQASYFKVTGSHMKVWSDMSTPAGIMALCELPSSEMVLANHREVLPVTVVCDNIRDPGNMGTIIRSAAAVGCERVIAPKGCVDVWEPKVLRAGAGAHFKCPVVGNIGWEAVGHFLPNDTCVYLADNDKQNKQRRHKIASRSLMEAIASIEPDSYTERDPDSGVSMDIDGTFLHRKVVELFKNVPLDIQSLFDVDFTLLSHVTVVIGGETEGLSMYAKKLCFDKAGERLFVPMTHHTESLNAGVALSVILFELKRQWMKSQVLAEQQRIK